MKFRSGKKKELKINKGNNIDSVQLSNSSYSYHKFLFLFWNVIIIILFSLKKNNNNKKIFIKKTQLDKKIVFY
mgnify:CR=1 FL=1